MKNTKYNLIKIFLIDYKKKKKATNLNIFIDVVHSVKLVHTSMMYNIFNNI